MSYEYVAVMDKKESAQFFSVVKEKIADFDKNIEIYPSPEKIVLKYKKSSEPEIGDIEIFFQEEEVMVVFYTGTRDQRVDFLRFLSGIINLLNIDTYFYDE